MKHGIYIRGWKYDWNEGRETEQKLRDAGRDIAADFFADPGCVSCSACGEFHWREFEVFECARCGAECVIVPKSGDCESGPPKFPKMIRTRLRPGLRVRYRGRPTQRKNKTTGKWETYAAPARYPAGRVPAGATGVVRRRFRYWCPDNQVYLAEIPENPQWPVSEVWEFDFDGIQPKPGYIFGAGFGPFLDDDFEVID